MSAADEESLVVVTCTAAASVIVYSAKFSVDELAAEFPSADSSWASQRRPAAGPKSRGRSRLPSGVSFDSRCSEHEPVTAHIDDALLRVAPVAAKLNQLLGLDENADHWGTLYVQMRTDGIAGGVTLSPHALQTLEHLRIRLDITVSFATNHDDATDDVSSL